MISSETKSLEGHKWIYVSTCLNLEEAKAFIRKDFSYIRSSNHLYNCVGHIECSHQMKCKKHPLDERYYIYETGNHGQIMSERRGIPHNIKKHFDHLVSSLAI